MLEYAGVGVVMENCVDELKGKGFEETSSNDDFGLAKTLQRFILSGPTVWRRVLTVGEHEQK